MSNRIEKVLVPDISGAEDVDVIDVMVKPGDVLAVEDALITLEGDKATMDVPSPMAGTVKSVEIKVGDKASEGTPILTVEVSDEGAATTPATAPAKEESPAQAAPASSAPSLQEVHVPDISGATDVDVIEVLVNVGDQVEQEDGLITLEGDKATMDVPAPFAGEIAEIKMKVGDKANEGDLILIMKTQQAVATKTASASAPTKAAAAPAPAQQTVADTPADFGTSVHAGPAVRRIAREFGIDLAKIPGSGAKGRIVKEDLQKFVKGQLQVAAGKASGAAGGGLSVLAAPKVDFSKFGEVETQALSKIKKISGANLHRNWVTIPHVTQFADADITELEAFRKQQKDIAAKQGIKLTPLVFLMKAVVAALKEFPHFNASLDASGENLVLKKYFHIGVAVDTPNGLVVPVIRDVDRKGLFELAKELGEISSKAREKGLGLADMQGGCFSISSLGGIGGTAFTPIINAPEVAILGVSRNLMKPVYNKESSEFEPRLMLPLSLSYDHRVIDGADGARFVMFLSQRLSDIRRLLL